MHHIGGYSMQFTFTIELDKYFSNKKAEKGEKG